MAQIPVFTVCNVGNNQIQIKDLSQENDFYLLEEVNTNLDLDIRYKYKVFKYSDTYTINYIQYTSTKQKDYLTTIFTNHDSFLDEVYYDIPKDGYFTIFHFILPTVNWLEDVVDRTINSDLKFLRETSYTLYVADEYKIYIVDKEKLLEDIKEPEIDTINNSEDEEDTPDSSTIIKNPFNILNYLIEVEDLAALMNSNLNLINQNTTISISKKDTFSINRLYDCYISISKDYFNSTDLRCLTNTNADLTFKRDFLQMTINILKYRVENKQLFEAQRVLEIINSCGSFCKSIKLNSNINNCGCYK